MIPSVAITFAHFFLLRFTIFNNVINTAYSLKDDQHNFLRQMQESSLSDGGRECNELIGVVTSDEIKQLGRLHLEPYYATSNDPLLIDVSLGIIYLPARFNVAIYKSCSSCESMDVTYLNRLQLLPVYHTNGYCSITDSLAYSSVASSLVMIPIDPNVVITNETTSDVIQDAILNGYTMRAFLSLRPTRFDYAAAPTVFFPSNVTEFIKENQLKNYTAAIRQLIVDYIPALLATSSGSIGIVPDYLGFGTSEVTANRTFMLGEYYDIAGAIGFLGARDLVTNITNNCSSIDMVSVTIHGIEDGAYGATLIAYALRQFSVLTTTLFLSGGPLDLETFWIDSIQRLSDSITTPVSSRLQDVFDNSVFTFNAGSSSYQSILNEKFINPGDDFSVLPTGINSTEIMTSDLVTFLRTKVSDINETLIDGTDGTLCEILINAIDASTITATATSTVNDFLVSICTMSRDNTAWKFIDTTDEMDNDELQLENPIIVCYSETDEVYSSNHYTDMNTSLLEDLDVYSRFIGPQGAADLNVGAGTSHDETLELCIIRPMLFLSLQGSTPESLKDRPNYISYYMNPLGQCNARTTLPDGAEVQQNPDSTMTPTTDEDDIPTTPSATAPTEPTTPDVDAAPTSPSTANAPTGVANTPTSAKSPSASPPTSAGSSIIWFDNRITIGLSIVTVLLSTMMLVE